MSDDIDWDRLIIEERMMKFFQYNHLPPNLRETSKLFAEIAFKLLELPQNPERTVMYRKLVEAKDCAVRTKL